MTLEGHTVIDEGRTPGRLDGMLIGTRITITLVVHQTRYWVYGPLSTYSWNKKVLR